MGKYTVIFMDGAVDYINADTLAEAYNKALSIFDKPIKMIYVTDI